MTLRQQLTERSVCDDACAGYVPPSATARITEAVPALNLRDDGLTTAAVEARWRMLDAGRAVRSALLDAQAVADMPSYERNIENYIGTVKVPVGLAGPLRINGQFARGDYHVPLATTEAALVASYSRGARLISECGGCTAAVLEESVSRTPGFAFRDLHDALGFASWVRSQQLEFERVAASTTRHGQLIATHATIEGNHVYLNFEFTTGDAAGQNMITLAAEALLRHIAQQSPVTPEYYFLEANHSGEKKANARALLGVRGKRVSAEVIIPADRVIARLHTTPERMADCWRMSALGCVLSGAVGVHGHYANALAAVYIACGQDAACVAESAVGVTRFEVHDTGNLYAAVTLPNLIVGTVGGGTGLPSQQSCLAILGLAGAGKSKALAEICAGLCLAGELSLAGAVCAGEFARAHRMLARGSHTRKP